MSTASIAQLADRIAPSRIDHPMITPAAADEPLARIVRVHQTDELYELVARLDAYHGAV